MSTGICSRGTGRVGTRDDTLMDRVTIWGRDTVHRPPQIHAGSGVQRLRTIRPRHESLNRRARRRRMKKSANRALAKEFVCQYRKALLTLLLRDVISALYLSS